MEKTPTQSVPKSIFVIIIAILASMFYYANFIDKTAAEDTVKSFYEAYFNKDYNTVAKHLSVFWAVQFLPQYQDLSPGELLANRADIEKDIAQVITEIEGNVEYPDTLSIEVDSNLTREFPNSAIVGYSFREDGKTAGTEVAVLINENGAYRIYSLSPANLADLENLSDEDMKNLDDSFKNLLQQK